MIKYSLGHTLNEVIEASSMVNKNLNLKQNFPPKKMAPGVQKCELSIADE